MVATNKQLAAQVRAVVETFADGSDDDDSALDLDSLTVVQLVEALEDEFAIRIRPRDVTAENFASVSALVGFVRTKRERDG